MNRHPLPPLRSRHVFAPSLLAALAFLLAGCGGEDLDDTAGGKRPEDFPELAADAFPKMDGGIALSADEIKGRNTWNLWCGGNEQFWDRMARESFGMIDLLKTLDSRNRATRFTEMGLINEPGFRQAAKADEFGVWLDERVEPPPAEVPEAVFGRSTGVMGFRLFPNPDFDDAARRRWDAERYYRDNDYAADPATIRPYRVGVSCGSCHIAFHPLNPPADPANPKWENLSSSIGNQYIREGRTFAHNVRPGGFFWEMIKTQPPGTSDTSRIATDHINNPNTINAIFDLGARLAVAHEADLAGETLLIPNTTARMAVPAVLKDGADSVGVPGATIRVYVNIGMYSQHWLQQHNRLVGLTGQEPFSVKTAQKHSVYWRATEQKLANIAAFFTRIKPMRLADAPGGARHLTTDAAVLQRGKLVFAENCAECHSGKRPPAGADVDEWFRQEVVKDDFLENNFLSDEKRHPVTRIKTNAGRALATNAKRGHIWHNFSSETYKNSESPGSIEVWNPYSGQQEPFVVPDGGPGYYRTPSLIGIWTSAPFLHNNALGEFTGDPSVDGRMRAFNDAVEKLLWPEKRLGTNSVWRTTTDCDVQLQVAAMPRALAVLLKPHADPDGYFRLGPIPRGTPVNLLANLDPEAGPAELAKLFLKVKAALAEIRVRNLGTDEARELMRRDIAPDLFKLSKCPDLVNDRGHTFGADLPDADKRALIEFLKLM